MDATELTPMPESRADDPGARERASSGAEPGFSAGPKHGHSTASAAEAGSDAIEGIVSDPDPGGGGRPRPFVMYDETQSASNGHIDPIEGFSPLLLRDRVTIMLLFREKVHVDQVEAAWKTWKNESAHSGNMPLWRYLLAQKDVDREAVFAEAADVYAFPKAGVTPQQAVRFIDQHGYVFTDTQWADLRRLSLLPLTQEAGASATKKRWIFGTHDPTRPEVPLLLRRLPLDSYDVQYVSEAFTTTVLSTALQFRNAYLVRANRAGNAKNLGTMFDQPEIDQKALEAEIAGSALLNLFEAMLVEGVREGASDIHIYVNPNKTVEIHFRVDGQLGLWRTEDRSLPEAFLAVVKDNAVGIDRFERDTAQDGFIERLVDDVLIRFRVSVLPLASAKHDERFDSIVIRILDDRKVVTDFVALGFEKQALERFEWAIAEPHGMVILTGPTGSGKSTTLYAALSRVVSPTRNVLSVEDPVEYLVPGVRQVKLSHKFRVQDAIRSILRHDPDVVMVGEMRDRETADLAIKLAHTGHLTFSTLHTNDSASAISRLYNMGIEPFLIANALSLVVSQRLVRVLCPDCREEDTQPDPTLLRRAGLTPDDLQGGAIFRAAKSRRCDACAGTGYVGRRAVMEVMPVTEEIRRLILSGGSVIDEDAIRLLAVMQGMVPLLNAAIARVKDGTTSLLEALTVGAVRVYQAQTDNGRMAGRA